MRRLEDQGYITGYSAMVNQTKLASPTSPAQVTLNDTSSKAPAAFNAAVKQISAVEQCHMMAANFDYLLKVRTKNMAEYRQVLRTDFQPAPCAADQFVCGDGECKDRGL